MEKPTLVILAAGMGSRYGGLKQIDGVGPNEEGIIEYSIYDAIRAGFGKVVFIIRKDIEAPFKEKFDGHFGDKIEIAYAFQEMDSYVPEGVDPSFREKPWGTAHAMLVAEPVTSTPFAVINADDYYGVEAFATMAKFLTEDVRPDLYSMVGYVLRNTLSDHGTVNRGVATMDANNKLTDVVERLKIQKEENDQATYLGDDENRHAVSVESLVSMNFWGFHPSIFATTKAMFQQFVHDNGTAPKAEFLIPEVVDKLIKDEKVQVSVLKSEDKWYGVTYRDDKPKVQEAFTALVEEKVYPTPLF